MQRQAEFDFGPHTKCLRPACQQIIPVRPEHPYCGNTCYELDRNRRQDEKLKRFIDEGFAT